MYTLYKIDAWRYDDGWNYNNRMNIGKVHIKGEPTTRKILFQLRKKNILPSAKDRPGEFTVDYYFSCDGIYVIERKFNGEPLYELVLDKGKKDCQ